MLGMRGVSFVWVTVRDRTARECHNLRVGEGGVGDAFWRRGGRGRGEGEEEMDE